MAAAAATLALFTFAAVAVAAGPRFDGPTISNPSPAPLFTLHDQDGHVVSLAKEHGRVVLVTFLYTHCPDVCPLTAARLNAALASLNTRQRAQVRVVAISVDPAGDTPSAVRRFVRVHRLLPQFRYLTGSTSALKRIWARYGVRSLRQAGGDRVDHTLYTLLLDRSLRGRVLFDATASPAAIAHDARVLLASRA